MLQKEAIIVLRNIFIIHSVKASHSYAENTKTSSISTSITVGAGRVERHRIGSSAFLFQETRPPQIIFRPSATPAAATPRVPARAPPPPQRTYYSRSFVFAICMALSSCFASPGVVCIALNQPRRRTSLRRRLFRLSTVYWLNWNRLLAQWCVSCNEPVNQVNHTAAPTRQLLNLSLVDWWAALSQCRRRRRERAPTPDA